jgi:hypothetical protein
MSLYREGRVALRVDAQCTVRWDAHAAFTRGLQAMQQTKAMDLVALLHDGQVALVEIKDFRGFRIENTRRITSKELAHEVAAKVHDTLASMTWAVHREHADNDIRRITSAFYRRDTRKLRIVFWLDEDHVDAAAADALRGAIEAELRVPASVTVTSLGIEAQTRRPLDWLAGTSVAHSTRRRR